MGMYAIFFSVLTFGLCEEFLFQSIALSLHSDGGYSRELNGR